MSIPRSARRSRPGWLPALATLIFLGLFLSLGFWQLDRAAEKRTMLATHEERVNLPPVALTRLALDDTESRYRSVFSRGVYDGSRQILLDNQVSRGRPGYHVYTPFLPDGASTMVLINRGWVPWGESRALLPDIAIAETTVVLSGRIDQPANPGLRLGDALAHPGWPKVVPYIDYGQLSEALGYPLEPAVVLLDPEQPQGYRREWRLDFGGLGPERHIGYAVQWFALSATLLVLYGLFGWRRNRGTDRRGLH